MGMFKDNVEAQLLDLIQRRSRQLHAGEVIAKVVDFAREERQTIVATVLRSLIADGRVVVAVDMTLAPGKEMQS